MSEPCGCETRAGRLFKCVYHQGFDAGMEAEREKLEAELWRLRQERDDARNEVKHAKLAGEIEERKRIEAIIERIIDKSGDRRDYVANACDDILYAIENGEHNE